MNKHITLFCLGITLSSMLIQADEAQPRDISGLQSFDLERIRENLAACTVCSDKRFEERCNIIKEEIKKLDEEMRLFRVGAEVPLKELLEKDTLIASIAHEKFQEMEKSGKKLLPHEQVALLSDIYSGMGDFARETRKIDDLFAGFIGMYQLRKNCTNHMENEILRFLSMQENDPAGSGTLKDYFARQIEYLAQAVIANREKSRI